MAKSKDQFSKKETEQRMKAALLGARITGPKHKSAAVPKQKPAAHKRRKSRA